MTDSARARGRRRRPGRAGPGAGIGPYSYVLSYIRIGRSCGPRPQGAQPVDGAELVDVDQEHDAMGARKKPKPRTRAKPKQPPKREPAERREHVVWDVTERIRRRQAAEGSPLVYSVRLRDTLPRGALGTFQLEYVYTTKRVSDGTTRRYGPYGPYWYGYTRAGYVAGGKLRSFYIGKEYDFEPDDLNPTELAVALGGRREALDRMKAAGR